MKKTILVSKEGGETRVCLLVSGKLVNIDTEGPSASSIVGNIYKGKISDINRSLNAAFIDIGIGKEGFLSISDVHPSLLSALGHNPRMSDVFQQGQDILVQVSRDAIGDKGCVLSTLVSLPGRYTVLIPAQEKLGVSRKLPDEERQRLRELLDEVEVPDGFGVIVRTAGQNRKKAELLSDLTALVKLWEQLEQQFVERQSPCLLVQEQGVAIRFLRDYLTTDVTEIVTDDKATFDNIMAFLDVVMPKTKNCLKLYEDRLPLFTRYNVERQVENMFLRDVPLPSGGRIVIDRTEALTAIDVNSGRTREDNIEELALKTNLEASEEIAIQMVLRDLGGLIVIDYIDMESNTNRNKVVNHFKDCLQEDKARLSIGKISQYGLLELTRQRLRQGVFSRATQPCKVCGGLGYHRTPSAEGLNLVRKIRELAVTGGFDTITVSAPVAVANFLQNSLRPLLYRLEQEYGIRLAILGEPSLFVPAVAGSKTAPVTKAAVQEPAIKPLELPVSLGAKADYSGPAPTEDRAPESLVTPVDGESASKDGGQRRQGQKQSPRPPRARSPKQDDKPRPAAGAPTTKEPDRPAKPKTGDPNQPRQHSQQPRNRQNENRAAQGQPPQPRHYRDQDSRPTPVPPPPIDDNRREPSADAQREKEGFLDSFIKKLLGIDR